MCTDVYKCSKEDVVEEKMYMPREFGKLINQSVLTLQRWDNKGIFKAHRTPTNRRYYTYTQYVEYLKMNEEKEGFVLNNIIIKHLH